MAARANEYTYSSKSFHHFIYPIFLKKKPALRKYISEVTHCHGSR